MLTKAQAALCSNHCPDEKGTESDTSQIRVVGFYRVATIAPTKRGLKDTINGRQLYKME